MFNSKAVILFFIFILVIPTASATKVKPTLELNNTAVFILFKIGKWVRVAYNNTKAVPPLHVYVYSKTPVKVHYKIGKLNGTLSGKWGFIGLIGKEGMKGKVLLNITVYGQTYHFVIPLIKSAAIQKAKPEILFKKSVIVRHAQIAIVLAVFGILTAYAIKRKTMLISPFNAINSAILFGLTLLLAYYLQFVRKDSTFWLALVFTASELVTYHIVSAGRRVWFMQILPSVRKILVEEGILYRCSEGLAFAIQSVGEAIKRLKGEHILVKDAEVGEIGKFSEDKMFKVVYNEIDWCDAILTLSAKIRRLKHDKAKKTDREGD